NAAVGLANAAGMPGRSPHIAGSPSTYLRAGNLRGASPPPTNTTSALRHAQSRRRRPRSPPPDRRSRHQGGSIPMSTSGSIPVSAKGTALLHRQSGLSAVERLNLALLVHRQHERLVGGIDVKAHDVFDLLYEIRIA